MRNILGSLLMLSLPFLVSAYMLREAYRAKDSATWPVVDAEIQSSVVKCDAIPPRSKCRPRVLYTFTLDGKTYVGTKVVFGDLAYKFSSDAQSIVNRYPKGAVVSVRYLSSDPDISVIEPGLKRPSYEFIVGGLLSLVLGTFIAVFLLKSIKKQEDTKQGEKDNVVTRSL